MIHKNNLVMVTFPNGQRRLRSCQSTVLPTVKDMAAIRNINDWFEYIRFYTDAMYCADAALDATIAADTIVKTANQIINESTV